MKSKTLLVPLMAVLLIALVGLASAGELIVDNSLVTTFNGVELETTSRPQGGTIGDVVPVRVTFTPSVTEEDVRIRVEMYGYRKDISTTSERLRIIEGVTETKLLSLELPSDISDKEKNYTLHVIISSPDKQDSEEYVITIKRELDEFTILSIDYMLEVSAGDVVPVAVVVENTGSREMEDGYVIASIPSIGATSSKGWFGDLVPVDLDDEDNEDSIEKTVYLRIPEDAESGVYDLVVEAYNKESKTKSTELIKVMGGSASTEVIPTIKNQDMASGETKTYELIIVNSADSIEVYNINTFSGSELDVSAPSVITVGPDSSEIVQITVKASEGTSVGSYKFTAEVNGEQFVFGANVTSKRVSPSALALTVVLAVIFVVLLIVLIVLLTKKEKPIEEAETSYY